MWVGYYRMVVPYQRVSFSDACYRPSLLGDSLWHTGLLSPSLPKFLYSKWWYTGLLSPSLPKSLYSKWWYIGLLSPSLLQSLYLFMPHECRLLTWLILRSLCALSFCRFFADHSYACCWWYTGLLSPPLSLSLYLFMLHQCWLLILTSSWEFFEDC